VRRTVLSAALVARARALGVTLRERCRVVAQRPGAGGVAATLASGETLTARWLVAADGLDSPSRALASLGAAVPALRRYGVRRHFAVRPWARAVEVHLSTGLEAYVTPVGDACVGVAFLFEKRGSAGAPPFDALVERFPALAARLRHAAPASAVTGAGPFRRPAVGVLGEQLVLLGDAAGYVDPLTGEGLALAFRSAVKLAEALPEALAGDPTGLSRYARWHAREFRHHERLTHALLALARRPSLRRPLLRLLGATPLAARALVRWALQSPPR
jgi:flavin-dependent dehydrogenase